VARARRQRTTPVLRLLARLGWQRDPDLWTVRCRDQHGRRAQVQVHLTETGIRIATSSPEPLELTPSEAGRLRVALRDGLLSLGQLTDPDGLRQSAPAPGDAPPATPNPRQRIRLHRAAPAYRRRHRRPPRHPDAEADGHHHRDTEVAA
jgi:hypothetical protein